MNPAGRTVLGGILALAVAAGAWRGRALSGSGVLAAVCCALLATFGGWPWAALLIAYFVAATLLSLVTRTDRIAGPEKIVAKGGRRDAIQVFANGGLFAASAALTVILPGPALVAGALGALAASSSDTWATEIGLRFGGSPRLITTGRRVAPGESGGVTPGGLVGALAGAGVVAAIAAALGFSGGLGIASLAGGFLGSLADSFLGAAVQERRWCSRCNEATERSVHVCGSPTVVAGGIHGLDNDVVNILSSAVGFLSSIIVYSIAARTFGWSTIG